jgi:hypothetical protein
MAHVAGTLIENSSQNQISDIRLQKLFRVPPLSGAIRKAEDPFPNIFVEEVPFLDGPHLILPGPKPGTSFEFRRLTESVFHHEHDWPPEFIAFTKQMFRGVLALSDVLAKRVGLKRGILGNSTERGDVILPEADRFRAMRDAVTFSTAEFDSFLAVSGVDAKAIAELIVNIGTFKLADHSISSGTLVHKPIIRANNQFVVAAPQQLICAANQLALRTIVETNLQSIFVRFYSEAVMSSVRRSLGRLRHLPTSLTPDSSPSIEGVSEQFYLFDSDKLLYVLLVCDTLEDFHHKTIEGIWGTPQLAQSLVRRMEAIEREMVRKAPFANEFFCLMVPCGVNRIHELVADNWPKTMLCLGMTAENLEIVSLIEAGDELAVWRFARKTKQVLKRARFVVFDELDLFAAYRDRNYSFPLADCDTPPKVLVKVGYGRRLRAKVANEQDWHPVQYFENNLIVNVNTLYGTTSVPIYGMPDSAVPCVCVEGLPCLVWVYPSNEMDESLRSVYFDFASTMGYWIWQLSPFLHRTVCTEMQALQMIHVKFALSPSVASMRREILAETGTPVSFMVPSRGTVTILVGDSFGPLMRKTDNEAERNLLRSLIPALIEACGSSVELSEGDVQNIVDEVAPLGLKRMLLHTDISHVPQLDPRHLPPYRLIQAGETEEILDELREHLVESGTLKRGHVPQNMCNTMLKEMVSFCFSKIAALVSSLRPDGLLESLIVMSESLIRESSSQQLSLASRIKTFEHDQNIVAELPKEMTEFAQTGIASRFIIEFVATQPPRGFRPMSLAIYDRLQALADRLITYGSISDSVYFGLADVRISVLPSGRMKVDNAEYAAAAMMQIGGLAFSRVAGAEDVFRRHLGERTEPIRPVGQENAIDRAFRSEFGHALTELVDFLIALGDISMELKPTTPTVVEHNELISRLVSQLNWNREKVLQSLRLFSLSPRGAYLTPPPDSRSEDLYPWRYNRAMSYSRRPLLVRERYGKTEVLWGHRHLDFAKFYLVELCRSTRLKAKSNEMNTLLAGFRHQAGKSFNDAVYNHLERVPLLIVRNRIRKVNHLRIGNLGDIDILCADQNTTTLWVIECKSLALARTPYEMAQEIATLTAEAPAQGSVLKKHQARTVWVEQHLAEVLAWLRADPELGWKVRPLIVVDAAPITPWLKRMPIPVVSLDMLKAHWPAA